MDEVETINNYLRMQAGEETDVIVGMGYDPQLDNKIGITLVATGFEHKDPFSKPAPVAKAAVVEEKIMMTLGVVEEAPKVVELIAAQELLVQQELALVEEVDPFAPHMQEPTIAEIAMDATITATNYYNETPNTTVVEHTEEVFHFELSLDTPETVAPTPAPIPEPVVVAKTAMEALVDFTVSDQPAVVTPKPMGLSKPQNIYAEPSSFVAEPMASRMVVPTPAPVTVAAAPAYIPTPVQTMEFIHREEPEEMQLVMKESAMPQASAAPIQNNYQSEDNYLDETEEQKRRAAERIQKLRNLSYNLNTTDPNNEFDSVPAYIRRNMELFGNSITSVENFYSKVTVGKDSNNQTQMSTINTFLDGKKPD